MSLLHTIASEFTPGAAGVWTGVLMFAGWMLREWRENRKLTDADKQARRQGYEAQVKLLTEENRALAADLSKLRHEYDAYRTMCQAETDGLRAMIIDLENAVAGLNRKTATQAIDLARTVAPERLKAWPGGKR